MLINSNYSLTNNNLGCRQDSISGVTGVDLSKILVEQTQILLGGFSRN